MAWRLRAAGKTVLVVGDSSAPCAASVAAGVINPVTGRWAVKSWQIENLLPEAAKTYRALEEELGIKIYHPIPLRRFCRNADDLKRVGRRSRNPRYADVLGAVHAQGTGPVQLRDTNGSFDILNAAYVDLPPLLEAMRSQFTANSAYHEGYFNHTKLKQDDALLWNYESFNAKNVIFCEGAAVAKNPWFPDLPMTPIKGETLCFECPELELPHSMYHNGKWLLPYRTGHFRLGATYNEADDSDGPTEFGKTVLLEGLNELLHSVPEIKIEQQLAGMRPSTKDARPILGKHPEAAGIFILNGLGSKGTSLAPFLTLQFLNYLLDGAPFDSEIDLARFK